MKIEFEGQEFTVDEVHNALASVSYYSCPRGYEYFDKVVKYIVHRLDHPPPGVVDDAMVERALATKVTQIGGMTVSEYIIEGGIKYWSPSSYLFGGKDSKPFKIMHAALTAAAPPAIALDDGKLERLTIAAKAMIAIVGDGSFVSGGSLRRGAAQLADALK